jgi:dienelactone hydrolase
MSNGLFRTLPVLALCGLLALAASPTANAEEEITYSGYRPESFADIYRGDWAVSEDELSGDLHLPNGDGPFPAVVLQHGSGHPRNLKAWWDVAVPALLDAGIAAFVADSYSGRGISGTSGDQRALSKAARVVDALMALKALAAHPKIDGARVGVTGYSFGGIVSIETADRRTAEAVLGPDLKFAAHLPVYPSCGSHREKIDMTGSPMLFLVGRQDDYTPAEFCEEYMPKLQAAGVPATLRVYDDAGHGFVKVQDRHLANAATFNDCGTSIINDDGYHEFQGGISEKGMTWAKMVVAVFKECGSRGASLYGTRESQRQALDDTIAFFTRTLKP